MSTLRTVDQLDQAGLIAPEANRDVLQQVASRYSIAVSEPMQRCMDASALADDPVARQFLPDARELIASDRALSDPIGDDTHSPLRGLVHRYRDRALLKATEICPVYCRFCFRRETVGGNAARPLSDVELDAIVDYLQSHTEIWELIVSGGDPLVLSDARLRSLMSRLKGIPHLKVIRIHTRVPVVNPERVTAALVALLNDTGKTVYVAIHANHANEFSDAARNACRRLADGGIPLLSQTVLLRGVNDTEEALGQLMRTFVELRVTPYYLHQLDLAPGTEHFRVPIAEGRALLRALRGTWSGLCQPTYVIDLPGGHGKVPIGPNYLEGGGDSAGCANAVTEDAVHIEDPRGVSHRYLA